MCIGRVGIGRQEDSRAQGGGFDLLDESSIATQAHACAAAGPYHLIVDATGGLTIDGVGPEKSLAALKPDLLAKTFQLNAIGPVMVLRHFAPLLAAGPGIYAKLSASVGSIADNRKGGWYGYRAAKAARNMLLQNAAIEASRRRPLAVFAALQPGTVRSKLSRPFVAPSDALAPEASAAQLLQVLQSLKPTGRAQFVDFRGASIPW